MPRCAGCLQTFAVSDQRIVADTEVFHRGCVGLVSQSLTNRLKHKVLQQQTIIAELETNAREAPRLRIAIDDANRDARNIRAERDRLAIELRDARSALVSASGSREYWEDRVQRVDREKESLQGQLEAARRELALHQTIQGAKQTSTTGGSSSESEQSIDNKPTDDTAKRFSLLELD